MKNEEVIALDRAAFNQGENAKYDISVIEGGGGTNYCCKRPRSSLLQKTIGSLCARDYKGIGNQYVNEGKVIMEQEYIVRRLTPTECARLQGFPSIVEVDMSEITRDELCAIAIGNGFIKVNPETGEVFGTRGPGGIEREEPIKLNGSVVNGYRVYSLHASGVKKQVRANRLVWISQYGMIPDGMVVDHINNDKMDNRISNLQLLTPEQNSTKAKEDGMYLVGDDNPAAKIKSQDRQAIHFLYWHTGKTQKQVAEMFGISESRVQQIVNEKGWAEIDPKDDFTEEEYKFWLDVRNTWAEINGKQVKDYTKEQMLKWYNGLHTDSAEYKMWGNGIALPNALYVMEGIARRLRGHD